MTIDLFKLANCVNDEMDFLEFLEAFGADWAEEQLLQKENRSSPFSGGTRSWQNVDLDAILNASASWGKASINGLNQYYQKPENPWRRAAHILYMGKLYE